MADAYKTLFQGAVPTAVGTLATVGASKSWIAKHWTLVNTTGGKLVVTLYKNGTDAAHQLTAPIPINGNDQVEWDGTEAYATAEYIAGVATGAGIYMVMSGDEVS
jgi:hypothetical protein